MTKTRQQIQFKAFAILTGGDVGANVSAEDATALDGYIDAIVAELNAGGTTYIDDPNTLDEALFLTFCRMVANAAADEFAGKYDPNLSKELKNEMRVLVRQTPGFSPQIVEYF